MNISEKKQLLQDLTENDLSKKVIIPLLLKLGFIDPIYNHHAGEKGKDIICKEYDQKFGKTQYIAVIVKKCDLTGSASDSSGFMNILTQLRQAVNEPYRHVYDVKEVYIDQCILITSGKILPTALESAYGSMRKEKLDKEIREIIDIDKLVNLVDGNFKEFWNEFNNEKDSLVKQRNYLLNNISKLIKLIMPNANDQQNALRLITNSEMNFNLLPFDSMSKYIACIRYGEVCIDEIDEYFTDNIDTVNCDIKDWMLNLKNDANRLASELNDIWDILLNILKERNPFNIVDFCEELRQYINPVMLPI